MPVVPQGGDGVQLTFRVNCDECGTGLGAFAAEDYANRVLAEHMVEAHGVGGN